MKECMSIGIIGLGQRGKMLIQNAFIPMCANDVKITALCDVYEDRIAEMMEMVHEKTDCIPFTTTDYREVIAMEGLDAIIISTSWEYHIRIAVEAMRRGIWVGMEVGGAYTIDDCWQLVKTSEETGIPCMMLENCCYGRREMMALNMHRQGVFGDVVYCTGAYAHDLREEIAYGNIKRHYRLRNYINRNCDNYTTHALGPIAKILRINRGNKFVSVSSAGSCSKGLHEYVRKKPEVSDLEQQKFNQSDIVVTTIHCSNGEMITLTLDTTLPRFYCRNFSIQGTKGLYTEATDSVFLDGKHNEFDYTWDKQWGNAKQFEEEYDHPIWKEYVGNEMEGHGGMDWLVCRAFIESLKNNEQPPIDVYDTAAWMSISVLSEMSIAQGGAAISAPDFTGGRWIQREPVSKNQYTLDEVVE